MWMFSCMKVLRTYCPFKFLACITSLIFLILCSCSLSFKTTVVCILVLMLKPLQMDVPIFFFLELFFAIIRSYEVAICF